VGQVAPCYTLLTVAVAGREYKVLYADLASPLLTCDTFLVHETKVINTCYTVGDYQISTYPIVILIRSVPGVSEGAVAAGQRPSEAPICH
jgi:hypothetical protein